ncbi:LytTR family transcriptional regulator DNA-binding domain-containing protein [Carboxylicivirga sediminis]|uniref:LytTR family transcriptional regulator DNA-binding domain-containing protein n=1 Tax=Carboxylicivirga sediminis TaxID=2006564 RepID=A0A941F4P1_9BACT|nr:LytTR family transcriptional regulator DNA-binding domain-containing protein [Carboxylicivirga sediminis]MBR8535883.1 LytTR family transcriptional regulator DNA-binding domain-containing protein [Carboxylicivirga sediminis]
MKKGALINIELSFFNELRYRLIHLLVTLSLCTFLLIGLKAFNMSEWIASPYWISSLGINGFILIGAIVMSISQGGMYFFAKSHSFKLGNLTLWLFSEIIILTFALSFIYGEEGYSYVTEWINSFKYVLLIVIFPYLFSLLILYVFTANKSDTREDINKIEMFNFKDERGQIKISIRRDNVLYLESTDNYITIFYLEKGNVKSEMVRSSLKIVQSEFQSQGLLRCHRSFAINVENIDWIRKVGRGYKIKVKEVDTLLPVSRSYTPQFIDILDM